MFLSKIWNQLRIYISIRYQHANTFIIYEQYTSRLRFVCVRRRSIKPCSSVTTIASSPRRQASHPDHQTAWLLIRTPTEPTALSNSNCWMTTAILHPSYILLEVEQSDELRIQLKHKGFRVLANTLFWLADTFDCDCFCSSESSCCSHLSPFS